MNEERFWEIIEEAWKKAGVMDKARQKLVKGKASEDDLSELIESLDEVILALRSALETLPQKQLMEFDRILERKLFEIDRADVQEHTDGSDDGFLYARGFIVTAGQAYYEADNAEPSRAVMDCECEEMCYLPFHLYEERFGKMPDS